MKYVSWIAFGLLVVLAGCGKPSGFFENMTPQNSNISRDGYTTPIRESYVQSYERAAYDLLWVLDNSPSMLEEVNYVRDNMDYFAQVMQTRRQIEFQMAVINTDWRDNTWGHGKLRGPVPIQRYDDADPVSEFKNAVNDIHMCAQGPCSGTNSDEMGLNAARQALTDNHAAFIRDDANLMIILVSDEEDHSCTPNGTGTACIAPRTTVPVSTFVSFFQTLKPAGTGLLALYPVVGRNLADCSTIYSVGQRYLNVLGSLPYGEFGSICQNEFGNSINRVANAIANNGLCFPLTYDPRRTTIQVFVNDQLQTEGYSFNWMDNAVCFDTNHIPANGSEIVNEYFRK